MGFAIFLLVVAGACVAACSGFLRAGNVWGVLITAVLGVWSGVGAWDASRPETIAKDEARERARVAAAKAQDLRDRTPHVIREADGCKVYQFKLGDKWPIFTRCNGTTVTDRPYEVCKTEGSGKMARKVCTQHVESIETVTK